MPTQTPTSEIIFDSIQLEPLLQGNPQKVFETLERLRNALYVKVNELMMDNSSDATGRVYCVYLSGLKNSAEGVPLKANTVNTSDIIKSRLYTQVNQCINLCMEDPHNKMSVVILKNVPVTKEDASSGPMQRDNREVIQETIVPAKRRRPTAPAVSA